MASDQQVGRERIQLDPTKATNNGTAAHGHGSDARPSTALPAKARTAAILPFRLMLPLVRHAWMCRPNRG